MRNKDRFFWMFTGPALFILSLYAVYPVIRILVLSLYRKNMNTGMRATFAGFKNYLSVFCDSHYWTVIHNSLTITFFSTALELSLGLGFALLMHRKFTGRGIARTSLLVPWALPTAVMALGWGWIFNDAYGVLNDLLLRFGFITRNIVWLGNPDTAIFSVIMADVWKTTPFVFVILLAGLQTIPEALYEAASIDGASRFSAFLRITLPLLLPFIGIALFFRAVQTFGLFDLVFILTGGGPGGSTETVAIYIYRTFMRYLDFGYGAALIVVTFVLVGIAGLIIHLSLARIRNRPRV